MKTAIKWFGAVTAAGMFAVLIMGSAVTNTGSEQGCGRQWPLCQGKFIPQMVVKTAIEFSHRAIVGFETFLILALAAGALYLYRTQREVRILAPVMVVSLFAQAGLGAWAVVYPQEAGILALHFGVSLIAFASVLLTAVYLFEADSPHKSSDMPVSRGLRWSIWLLALYAYGVVYSGAYVRHSNASLACKGWPLCNDAVTPQFHNGVAAVFGHRVGGAILTIAIAELVAWTARIRDERPDLFRASLVALALALGQALSGAIVVWTRVDLFSTLLHAALVGLLFGVLCYLAARVIPRQVHIEESIAQVERLRAEPSRAGASR
jgi:cytochrome c oxidase assembly protein subunit 15